MRYIKSLYELFYCKNWINFMLLNDKTDRRINLDLQKPMFEEKTILERISELENRLVNIELENTTLKTNIKILFEIIGIEKAIQKRCAFDDYKEQTFK